MTILATTTPGQRITILHYSAPPIVGGVENTIYHHTRLLIQAGYKVQVIAGRGKAFHPQVTLHLFPEVDSCHPWVLAIKQELDRGQVSSQFYRLRERIIDLLRPHIATTSVLIAHNIFTLHKNLPLTAALYCLLVENHPPNLRILAWHHDLAWCNPQYAREVHSGYPWDLLRQPWPGVIHVTVSELRQREIATLYGIPPHSVHVISPGVDLAAFFRWTEMTKRIVEAYRLLDSDLVLLLPARITRRKNIQLVMRMLASLRQKTGLDARLVVTGPPGPHNPSNAAYLMCLQALRSELQLTEAAHFVYELGGKGQPFVPDAATMTDLYLLADALIFPSFEEGFGIPVLEAGLIRLPIFCSDIPPMRAIGNMEVHYFSPHDDPVEVGELIVQRLLSDPAYRLRRRIFRKHLWERILYDHIIPLVEGKEKQPALLPDINEFS